MLLQLRTINSSSIFAAVGYINFDCSSYGLQYLSIGKALPTYAFAASLLYVARYHIERGGDNFVLARKYAEQVAVSNSTEVQAASDLLRRLQGIAQFNETAREALNAPSRAQDLHSETEDMYASLPPQAGPPK